MSPNAAVDDVDLRRDRNLVELAQAGDVDAFGELYGRYFRRLERFCVKRLGDPTEAEEVAQEAFTRAWRALPAFAGERRFYPWMTVIASRICVDTVRRQARLDIGEVDDTPVVEPGFSRLEAESDLATLQVALDRITRRHREALELREAHGWSYQHIADHYQVSVGTVEALLWRARQALRREFLAVCSCFAALPLVRRWSIGGGNNGPTGALTALGSVGTAVVLAVGAALPAAASGPAPAAPAAAIRILPAEQGDLQAAPPPSVAISPGQSADVVPVVRGGRPAALAPGATVSPAAHPAASTPLSALVPRPQVMSSAAAASAARHKPIVIDLAPLGPVIGIDPGPVALPPTHIQLGGQP